MGEDEFGPFWDLDDFYDDILGEDDEIFVSDDELEPAAPIDIPDLEEVFKDL